MKRASLFPTFEEIYASGKRWGLKGALSIADQGVVSGANFAAAILLARWLNPGDYGAYAVSLSVLLFLAGFHNALILEPMSVLGANRYMSMRDDYLAAMIVLHTTLTAVLSLLLTVGAALTGGGHTALGRPLNVLAAVSPVILLFWLLRRACYLTCEPGLALRGSTIYALAMGAGLLIIQHSEVRSTSAAFAAMGAAGAAACAALLPQLTRRAPDLTSRRFRRLLKEIALEHWAYGRWIVGVAFMYWLTGAVYPILLGMCTGLEGWASKQVSINREEYLPRFAVKTVTLVILLTISYGGLLLLFRAQLVHVFYRNGFYDQSVSLLPYFITSLVLRGVSEAALGIALRAAGHPQAVCWSTAGGALVTLTAGALWVTKWQAVGAASGLVLSNLVQVVILALWLSSVTKRQSSLARATPMSPEPQGCAVSGSVRESREFV